MVASKSNQRQKALQTSARATLIWGIAALIIVQLGVRGTIDFFWPELRDPTFEIKKRRLDRVLAEHTQEGKRPALVIMTGSSVTNNAFRAKRIEQDLKNELGRNIVAFNMGCQGASPLTQLVWLHRLVERGIRPDFVCVECSPHLCEGPTQPCDASRLPAHILTRTDLQTMRPYVETAPMRRESRFYRWVPTYYHRLTILNYLHSDMLPIQERIPTWGGTIDDRCWAALAPRDAESRGHAIRAVTRDMARLKQFAPGAKSVHALEDLLAFLKAERIPTALVVAPQGPALQQVYDAKARGQFLEDMAVLCRKHESRFVDASTWLAEEDFADCIHAEVPGADRFSTRLKTEVLVPGLSRPWASR